MVTVYFNDVVKDIFEATKRTKYSLGGNWLNGRNKIANQVYSCILRFQYSPVREEARYHPRTAAIKTVIKKAHPKGTATKAP